MAPLIENLFHLAVPYRRGFKWRLLAPLQTLAFGSTEFRLVSEQKFER